MRCHPGVFVSVPTVEVTSYTQVAFMHLKNTPNVSPKTLPRADLQTIIDLIEANVPSNTINIIPEVRAGQSITSDLLR